MAIELKCVFAFPLSVQKIAQACFGLNKLFHF